MNGERHGFSESLGSLRGIAATVVVIYHAQLIFRVGHLDDPHRLGIDLDDPLGLLKVMLLDFFNGSAAVVLFFVLSGTVLAMSLDRSGGFRTSGWGAYYVRRAFRLLPLLVAVALAVAGLHHLYFDDVGFETTTTWMGNYFRHDPAPDEIALNALGYSNSLNSPAWTIRVEIAASILFPAIYLVVGRPALIAPAALALVALMYLPLSTGHVHVFLVSFFAGALIPGRGAPVAQLYGRLPGLLRVLVALGALATMAGFQTVWRPWVHVDPTSVLVVTLCAAFLVTVVLHGAADHVLRSRALVRVGDWSYGLYLWHFPVLFALAHLIAPLVDEAQLEIWQAFALNGALAAATLAVTLPLAAASYALVEKPMQDLGRRLAKRLETRRHAMAPGE